MPWAMFSICIPNSSVSSLNVNYVRRLQRKLKRCTKRTYQLCIRYRFSITNQLILWCWWETVSIPTIWHPQWKRHVVASKGTPRSHRLHLPQHVHPLRPPSMTTTPLWKSQRNLWSVRSICQQIHILLICHLQHIWWKKHANMERTRSTILVH